MARSGRIKVAAVQLDVAWMDPEKNIERIVEFIDQAGREHGADLVVFPELATSGYLIGRDAEFMRRYRRAALTSIEPMAEAIGAATRRAGCVAVVGVMREHPRIPSGLCNSVVVVGADGATVGVYDKTHIPSEEKHYFFPGRSLDVFETPVATIGCLICADNSFPEAARVLALRGAEIGCVSYSRYNFPDPTLYRSLVIARAYENQLPFVAANRVGAQRWADSAMQFEGQSCIVGATGRVLAMADHADECVISAEVDFDEMADTRLWQTRFRDRRPDLYSALTEPHLPVPVVADPA